jgi:hypothetical protein
VNQTVAARALDWRSEVSAVINPLAVHTSAVKKSTAAKVSTCDRMNSCQSVFFLRSGAGGMRTPRRTRKKRTWEARPAGIQPGIIAFFDDILCGQIRNFPATVTLDIRLDRASPGRSIGGIPS